MSDLTAAASAALEAVTDDETREAEDLCRQFGIPDEHARQLAAAIAVCSTMTGA